MLPSPTLLFYRQETGPAKSKFIANKWDKQRCRPALWLCSWEEVFLPWPQMARACRMRLPEGPTVCSPCLTSPHLPLLSGNHWFGFCICESVLLYSFLHFIFLDSTCNLHIVFIVLSLDLFLSEKFFRQFFHHSERKKTLKMVNN